MAQGKSGRVVIDIDPTLKKELYVALAEQQLTMKAWFTGMAEKSLAERSAKAGKSGGRQRHQERESGN
jgi:hypothetical protein